MKKAFVIILLLLSVILAVSCGDADSTSTSSSETTSSETTSSEVPGTSSNPSSSDTTTEKTPDTEETPDTNYQNEKWDGETLKVLAIGNSFSDDSMEYLYNIAKAEGVKTVILGNLYIGGCSLQTHLNNAQNNSPAYEYRKNTNGKWNTTPSTTMLEGILDEEWDVISMQQVSGYSGVATSYRYLDGLADYVKANMKNPDCQLAWNMTWAYQSDSTHSDFPKYQNNQATMYQKITETVEKIVLSRDDFPILLTPGTAIQNMRTSFLGDTLTRDGYHLSYDIGRYIAGYTWFRILTGRPLEDLKYAPVNIIPNDTYKNAVLEAVNAAATTPLAVTPSTYTEKPAGMTPDLSAYNELDYSYTLHGFWQSDSAENYNKIVTGAGNSPQFIATELFTKETLPVGSVIVVDAGWQYRPERWTGNSLQSNRPGQTTTEYFTVTDEFWDGYLYRAFNISVIGASRNVTDDDAAHFRIYVPKSITVPDKEITFEKAEETPTPEIDLSKYTEYDFTYTMGAYWNSTDSTYHHEIIANADNSGYFIATETFTKETLPVGSIILIDEGWQYRPEGWKDDGVQPVSTRPANVTTYMVEVTEEWWGDYVLRAFNIAVEGNNVGIKNDPNAVTHFKIYIPNT